jgi:hypothetical protein
MNDVDGMMCTSERCEPGMAFGHERRTGTRNASWTDNAFWSTLFIGERQQLRDTGYETYTSCTSDFSYHYSDLFESINHTLYRVNVYARQFMHLLHSLIIRVFHLFSKSQHGICWGWMTVGSHHFWSLTEVISMKNYGNFALPHLYFFFHRKNLQFVFFNTVLTGMCGHNIFIVRSGFVKSEAYHHREIIGGWYLCCLCWLYWLCLALFCSLFDSVQLLQSLHSRVLEDWTLL